MMDISRRVAVLSISIAAAAGLAFPAIFERSSTPELARPVELSRADDGAAMKPAGQSPPAVPSDPVPVAARGQRLEDDARPNVDEDGEGDDRSETRGDDDKDDKDDGNRPAPRGDDDSNDDAGGDSSDDGSESGDD